MDAATRMQALLEPLKLYRWEGSYQWAELKAEGEAIDRCLAAIETLEREMNLRTARDFGLSAVAGLLAHAPKAPDAASMAAALAALLRIQDGSFTLQAINDNLRGCGLVAEAVELEPGRRIRVIFPEVAGIPEDFDRISPIIEDILPCHLAVDYRFWFLLWRELEERLQSWQAIEALGLSWKALQTYVW